jgi:signal transduction histidine kinase
LRLPRFPRGILPILPIAPAIVVVVGLGAALVIALLGLSQLQETSDDASSLRAEALSATLAARLGAAAPAEQSELVNRAARRSAAEILLVKPDGQIVVNESFGSPPRDEIARYLAAGKGEGRTALGRVRWAARSLSTPGVGMSVITFVSAPSPPSGFIGLVNAVAALTALLLGIAVAVALAYAKAARDDVDYVRRRIVDMARPHADPAGEPVPIRSLDQVGVLTAAFNLLVARFAAAERSYRADLVQAKEGDRERSAFLAGLSHELRTPLNAILGFTHVLESEVDGPLSGEAREHLKVITQSGEHLKTLIDDVLDLSALETGQLRLSRRPVDVRALCEQVVREAKATVREKSVRLSVIGQNGLMAYADARRVRQIVTNLIANAIKATAQGAVTIEIAARDPFVALIVRDTGAGISPEDVAAIFQPYRQAGDRRSRRGGVGLGLSIAQRLVGMHGGNITVESKLGQGSTFTVCLPRAEEDAVELTSRPDWSRDFASRPDWSRPDLLSRPDLISRPDFASRPDLISRPDALSRPDLVSRPDYVLPELPGPGRKGRS